MLLARAALPLVLLLTVACSPATGGLGSATFTDSGSDTGTDSGGSEESSADGSTTNSSGDGDGDGSPTTSGDGDGTSGDGDGTGDGDGDNPCGNGAIDPGEECDGDDLGGQDCVSLNFASGTLACDGSCKFDTSGCMISLCGNGVIDQGEECEPGNFGGEDCISMGLGPGSLVCTESCKIDSSMCGVPGEGEGCTPLIDECPNNLYCQGGTCYDGSLGDPCSFNGQCLSNNCSDLINGHCQ